MHGINRVLKFMGILLLVSQTIWGQPKYNLLPFNTPIEKDKLIYISDTEIRPSDLTKSNDSFQFRFSTELHAIEIWTNDYKFFNGRLINYAATYNTTPQKFYGQSNSIDTSIARDIHNLFAQKSVFQIPPQDSIKGWISGLDGGDYKIAVWANKKYSFKKYWSPDAYPAISEAVIIAEVKNHLYRILKLKSNWHIFLELLPKGCYNDSGYYYTCTKK